jgi:hypothetical protein
MTTGITTTETAVETVLYRATSIIDGWPHRNACYDGVRVTWFAHRDQPVAPWAVMFAGWAQHVEDEYQERRREGGGWETDEDSRTYAGAYTKSLADELFTAGEAAALAHYLKTVHDEDVTITEQLLPMPTTAEDGAALVGCSAVPCGGSTDQYALYLEDGYDLPIEICGYYWLEQHPRPTLVAQRCTHRCEHHGEVPWADVPPAYPPGDPWASPAAP